MATNWVKRHTKAMTFTALAVLFIGAVGLYPVHAHTESGYKSNVYYEFSLDDLEASDGWAYSYHYFYIINNRSTSISVDWESSHNIRGNNTDFDLPSDTVFGTVSIGPPSSGDNRFQRSDTRMTYYGYLDFDVDDYYLEAYTRIHIHGISIPKKKITKTLDLQP